MKTTLKSILLIAAFMSITSCGNDDTPSFSEQSSGASSSTAIDTSSFAKGADVSWITEMEANNVKFYNAAGKETECMELMKSLGINSVRLRVWVNPSDGWCNKEDVIAKAWRAHNLGLRLMIDFHYSDTWADPSAQYKPAAWEGLGLEELKAAITDHTEDVLNALKDFGIEPEWVQVGNEVRPGMLWDTDASVSGATWDVSSDGVTYLTNQENFAAFITTGYDAVKAVFPDAKVVVHLDGGDNNDSFKWIFGDILNPYGAKYDVIGMSLYPDTSWESSVSACVANMKDMISRYGKEVMICEVGMDQEPASVAKECLRELLTQAKAIDQCLGVFYWEPECYNSWNGYNKGAFSDDGKPTEAMDAFSD